ncbi:MAG: actB, partial [Bacteroidetes bacterium]|nr:actB [Bacteroidota bacterium]
MERRNFLKIAGAATVATALPGCTPKEPKSLLPYIIPDEEIIPGRSVMYATVCRECPAGCGMNVRVREGRATKAEGNPYHPVNKGTLCARGQAALQGLYNPDRIQTPLRKTDAGGWERISWEQAEELVVAGVQKALQEGEGREITWVSSHVTGSLDRLIDEWLKLGGSSRRYRYEPFGHEAVKRANDLVFGIPEIPRYRLNDADMIISFGADILETWMSPVELTGQFAQARGSSGTRSRFIYVGPRLSLTASNADEWVAVAPEAMGTLALSILYVLLNEGTPAISREDAARLKHVVGQFSPDQIAASVGLPAGEIVSLGKSLAGSRKALAIAGGPLLENDGGVRTIAAVNLLNYACGAVRESVDFGAPSSMSRLSSYEDLLTLVALMEGERIPLLFLSDVNPVYALPEGGRFAAALRQVPFTVALTSFLDETSSLASLVLPIHTPLETWGDFEPYPGLHGLMQPVMEPVFPTKGLGDLLLETGKKLDPAWKEYPIAFSEYLKEDWKQIHKRSGEKAPFDTFWTESLARGGVWEEGGQRKVKLASTLSPSLFRDAPVRQEASRELSALIIYPSISFFDGRGANRPWLQELPDPMTRLVWGSWIEIHPDDAAMLGVRDGDGVTLETARGQIEAGAFITHGIAKGSVAVPMGQGHAAFGRYASGVGSNPVRLLEPSASIAGGMQWAGTKVQVRKGSGTGHSASVQEARSEHHREIAREISQEDLNGGGATEEGEAPTIYPHMEYAKHHWGMVIDLDRCTGCGACVTACYAENNIPVVGKDEVINGREMAWLRIDRYYQEREGADKLGRARFIPMLCQHCGMAPCET